MHSNNKQGLYDAQAQKMLAEPLYEGFNLDYVYEGYIQIYEDGKVGLCHVTYGVILDPLFDELEMTDGGNFIVRIGNQYGFVDEHGSIILRAEFDEVEEEDDAIRVVKDGTEQYYTFSGVRIKD